MNTKNTIMKIKEKLSKSETSKKWMNYLQNLKKHLNYYDEKNLTVLTDTYKVCHRWPKFLKDSKIVIIDDFGCYRWNEEFQITMKIINDYRKYQALQNKKQRLKRINKSSQQQLDLLIETAKPKSKSKLKNDMTKSKLYGPYQEKQVGLIRKFLKWIY